MLGTEKLSLVFSMYILGEAVFKQFGKSFM